MFTRRVYSQRGASIATILITIGVGVGGAAATVQTFRSMAKVDRLQEENAALRELNTKLLSENEAQGEELKTLRGRVSELEQMKDVVYTRKLRGEVLDLERGNAALRSRVDLLERTGRLRTTAAQRDAMAVADLFVKVLDFGGGSDPRTLASRAPGVFNWLKSLSPAHRAYGRRTFERFLESHRRYESLAETLAKLLSDPQYTPLSDSLTERVQLLRDIQMTESLRTQNSRTWWLFIHKVSEGRRVR